MLLSFITEAQAIQLAVAIPLLGGLIVMWMGERNRNLREAASLITAVLEFAVVASLTPEVLEGARPSVDLFEMLPGLTITLTVEPLGQLFALIASGLWIVNTVYSIGYMRGNGEANQTRFYVCFTIAISAAVGIAYAGNLLTLFLFYEVLTISTYPLVTHSGKAEAIRGGRVYLGILMATSIGFLFLAMLWTYNITGTLDFVEGGILADKVHGPELAVLMFLYMFGIGKAALMPVHRWLPAAMVAPTPVSALLHAVAVVKAGVFSVVKVIVYIFGLDLLTEAQSDDWLLFIAGFTIISASIIALRQDNLKRRLAYSTVSQLSYVILATTILAPISVAGAVMHIAAHAFGKITLFFAAGSIYTAAHKTEISQLDGIGKRMPFTMAAFAIGALSMIGVPPTAGFISKWYILSGALETGEAFAILVIVASTLLNAGYFLPIVYAAFFKDEQPRDESDPYHKYDDHGEAPVAVVMALCFTALGTVVLFFYPDVPLALGRALVGG
ncbi:monovalent cation/H+ antiporter subunit D family protein [Magnetovibrio sp.]|uniref:monovalent cation/H+ antiporter subunit D family protein n=1 Tax=Magnetovibrio sp. TaxID=2024836 RepID=UPI002F93FEA0